MRSESDKKITIGSVKMEEEVFLLPHTIWDNECSVVCFRLGKTICDASQIIKRKRRMQHYIYCCTTPKLGSY